MNKVELINLFNKNFNEFLDILIDKFPKEQDFILINILLNTNRLSSGDLINNFSNVLIPNKQLILVKSSEFFINNTSNLFYGLHLTSITSFKPIWNRLNSEEREMLWRWFKLFLNICLEYKKLTLKVIVS